MLLSYLRTRVWGVAGLGLACIIFAVVFILCGLSAAPVGYAALLFLFFFLCFTVFDFLAFRRRHLRLQHLCGELETAMDHLPEAVGQIEADYQELLRCLHREHQQQETGLRRQYSDMTDYYTTWVHQIKTPIAAMRLLLQEQDTPESRALTDELQEIEQYVEMVLCYLRLSADSTDFLIREYDLDGIVRQAVRRYASRFIQKKLRLVYEPLHLTVLTDEKWLLFVIEQVLSNALKYTPSGSVTIFAEAPRTLCIRDTGIGIEAADLPRIFETGFTGCNGRLDKHATGLGLGLSRRILERLGHRIAVESEPGHGTTVRLFLDRSSLEVE